MKIVQASKRIAFGMLVAFQIVSTGYGQLEWVNTIRHDERGLGGELTTQEAEISPDGQYIVTGGSSISAIMWNLKSGEKIRSFSSNTDVVDSLAFSPDGTMLAAGLGSPVLVVWDFPTGKQLQRFPNPTFYPGSPLQNVTFSPDGKKIIAHAGPKSLWSLGPVVWDLDLGRIVHTFDEPRNYVENFVFSQDGHELLVNSYESYLYDVQTGELKQTYPFHGRINPDFTEITYVSQFENEVSVITLDARSKDAKEVKKYKPTFKGWIGRVSENGAIALTVDEAENQTLIPRDVINPKDGTILHRFNATEKPFQRIKFSKDGRFLILISWTGGAEIYDLTKIETGIQHANRY